MRNKKLISGSYLGTKNAPHEKGTKKPSMHIDLFSYELICATRFFLKPSLVREMNPKRKKNLASFLDILLSLFLLYGKKYVQKS